MPIGSPEPPESSVCWGVALAVTSVLLIGGGAIVWAHREPEPDFTAGQGVPPGLVREAAMPLAVEGPEAEADLNSEEAPVAVSRMGTGLYSVNVAVEHGTRVVKIRVVRDGDELVIDAATGRLLEARPCPPSAPPTGGKVAAPLVPTT